MRFVGTLIVYVLVFATCVAFISQQPDLSRGRHVVQLNYDWNKSNTYQWKPTAHANYWYMSLDKFPELKNKMKIKTVPTIIVIDNGREVKRYEAELATMRIGVPQNEIIK